MPTYEYRCKACSHSIEVFQKMTEEPLRECPKCAHETLQRGPGGGIGVQFGPGFFNNGYETPSPSTQKITTQNNNVCCPCGKNNAPCRE